MNKPSPTSPATRIDAEGRIYCFECGKTIEVGKEYELGGSFVCEDCVRSYVQHEYGKRFAPEEVVQEPELQLSERSQPNVRHEAERIRHTVMRKRANIHPLPAWSVR